MAGIFVVKGMKLNLANLHIDFEEPSKSSAELLVGFDVSPTWLAIAIHHLREAQGAAKRRRDAFRADDTQEKAVAMEAELRASMQAIVSSAICVDAFYAWLQPHAKIEGATVKSWRENRTPRHKQIGEVIRRCFKLRDEAVTELGKNLKELDRARGLAVHPPAGVKLADIHPEEKVGVEWRFALFCQPHAKMAVTFASTLLFELAHKGEPTEAAVKLHLADLRTRLADIFGETAPLEYLSAFDTNG